MTQALTNGACVIAVDGHLGAVQARDGSWIVQVPPTGARVTSATGGRMLNPRGTNTADVHTNMFELPCAVVPGDSFVCALPGSGRGGYWDAPGRSACSEAMAGVFVPYPVTQGLLRPPAIGNHELTRWLRTVPIPEHLTAHVPSVVDVQALGIDWSRWGAAEPTIEYLTALLRPFAGEFYDGWSTDTRTPDRQHPGYGSYYASLVSQALVQLCSTADANSKRELALAVVQRGLDLVGAFADGRRNYPLGGHMAGRKALVVATGHLLGVPELCDPSAILGPVFQEDGCYRAGSWFFPGWAATWQYRDTPPTPALTSHPGNWGLFNDPGHSALAWQVSGYMPQVVGAQIGTALAMRLLGRTREWGTHADAMVAQWMQGPPASSQAQLQASGIQLPWGSDYALVKGAGFCATAWRKYA